MHLVADNPSCDFCDRSAIIELHDQQSGRGSLYCGNHKPDLWPGKHPHLKIVRYRSEPGSVTSRLMEMAEDSVEHKTFRWEMCDLLILQGEGACRYYLSKLTGSDQFSLWNNEFIQNVQEFLVRATGGTAKSFEIDQAIVGRFRAVFKQAFTESRCLRESTLTKPEQAVIMLVKHPSWSDEEIANVLATSVKQLRRNSDYRALRSAIK